MTGVQTCALPILTTTRQIEFIATNPSSIIIQADIVQLQPQQETGVTAVLRDAQNNLVKGQLVTFRIVTDESNGQLLESQITTNSLGRATVTYQAGNSGTGSSGVEIEAQTSAGSQPAVFNPVVQMTAFKQPVYCAQFPAAFQD